MRHRINRYGVDTWLRLGAPTLKWIRTLKLLALLLAKWIDI